MSMAAHSHEQLCTLPVTYDSWLNSLKVLTNRQKLWDTLILTIYVTYRH